MVKKIKPFIPLLVLYGFTIYLLIYTGVTTAGLLPAHYIGFIVLGIASISLVLRNHIGYLILGAALLIGTFANASFTPTAVTITIRFGFSISFSWHYLALLVLYIILNRTDLPSWFAKTFGIPQEE